MNWMYGEHWITFVSGEPELVSETPFATPKAAMSEPGSGELRIYMAHNTAMQLVASDHQVLPTSPGAPPTTTVGSQDALFVPRPGNPDEAFFIIFRRIPTAPPAPTFYGFRRLFVGGAGDLPAVLDTGYTWFMDTVCEKRMVVPHSNGVDYWFVGQVMGMNTYHAYRITADGITEPPVVSQAGTAPTIGQWAGEICPNVQGDSFVSVSSVWGSTGDSLSIIEVFDFDQSTGAVAHQHTLTDHARVRGVEFSPNSRFLYVADKLAMQQVAFGAFATWISQYDLWAADLIGSRVLLDSVLTQPPGIISSGVAVTALGLAPDGRIYVAHDPWVPYLGVITQPDLPAPDCAYVEEGFYTATPMWWLPNFMKRYHDDVSLAVSSASSGAQPRVVPNPVTAHCEVLLPGTDGPCSFSWIDALGRTARVQQGVLAQGRVSLNASGLSAGPYLLRAGFGDGRPAVVQRAWVLP